MTIKLTESKRKIPWVLSGDKTGDLIKVSKAKQAIKAKQVIKAKQAIKAKQVSKHNQTKKKIKASKANKISKTKKTKHKSKNHNHGFGIFRAKYYLGEAIDYGIPTYDNHFGTLVIIY